MQNAYLVFDIGTGNTRVALVGEDGAILDIAKGKHTHVHRPHRQPRAVF